MEAFGDGLALDKYVLHLRAYKKGAYELKGNGVKRQPKLSTENTKFAYESLIYYHFIM